MVSKNLQLIFAGLLLLVAPAGAAKVNYYKNIPAYNEPLPPPVSGHVAVWMTDDQYKEELKAASKRQNRMTANAANLGAGDLPADLSNLIDAILAAKTPDELDGLIQKADKSYDTLSPDAKFVVAQLVPLRSMRGFIFHIRPLAQKAAMTDGTLITVAKSISSGISVYFPRSKGDLLLSYLETPADNAIWAFSTDSQMQSYLVGPIFDQLKAADMRLEALNLKTQRVIWDNRLVNGEGSYVDNIDRFKFIGEAERYAAIAGMKASMANLYVMGSYNIEGLFSFYDSIGKTIGFGALAQAFGGSLSGATAGDRIRIVASIKNSNPHFMQLFPDQGDQKSDMKSPCPDYQCTVAAARMAVAFQYFSDSVKAAHLAWNELPKSDEQWSIMSPGLFRPFGRENEASFANLDRMVAGRDTFTSAITKKKVTVDLPALFLNPPWDLTLFMPSSSMSGPEFVSKRTPAGVAYYVRDYSVGRAQEWNYDFYGKYFPGTSSTDQVKFDAQVISQVWGGGILGLPMSIFFL